MEMIEIERRIGEVLFICKFLEIKANENINLMGTAEGSFSLNSINYYMEELRRLSMPMARKFCRALRLQPGVNKEQADCEFRIILGHVFYTSRHPNQLTRKFLDSLIDPTDPLILSESNILIKPNTNGDSVLFIDYDAVQTPINTFLENIQIIVHCLEKWIRLKFKDLGYDEDKLDEYLANVSTKAEISSSYKQQLFE